MGTNPPLHHPGPESKCCVGARSPLRGLKSLLLAPLLPQVTPTLSFDTMHQHDLYRLFPKRIIDVYLVLSFFLSLIRTLAGCIWWQLVHFHCFAILHCVPQLIIMRRYQVNPNSAFYLFVYPCINNTPP